MGIVSIVSFKMDKSFCLKRFTRSKTIRASFGEIFLLVFSSSYSLFSFDTIEVKGCSAKLIILSNSMGLEDGTCKSLSINSSIGKDIQIAAYQFVLKTQL